MKNKIFRIDHYMEEEMIQKISLPFVSEILFLITFGTEDFIDNIKLPLLNAGVEEERGGYYDTGALEIWCKTIPFSFVINLPWINQLPLPEMQFGRKG